MGCAPTKPSTDSPPRGLEKLKMENGYARVSRKSSSSRESSGGRILRPEPRLSNANNNGVGSRASTGGSSSGSSGKEGKTITARDNEGHRHEGGARNIGQEGKPKNGTGGKERAASSVGSATSSSGGDRGGSNGSSLSRRSSMLSTLGDLDELVDGWPKWLTDNIPKDALAGLVPKSADAYDKLDKVGSGTYSNVYKARDRETGKIVALKKVRFETSEPESVKFMAREIMMLRKLDHPNIVKLEGLATSRMQYSLYLVFKYMQTDLSRIITRPDQRLTESQVKCYMQQLLEGLQHCHERGILHRDIKGSNLLIDKDGMLKIADFGLANYYDPDKKVSLTNRVVTLWYRAPELLLGTTHYGPGIDLWSAGCLLAEMFAGRPIMPGRTEVEQLHKIFKLCGTPSEEYWKKLKLSTTFRPPHSYKSNLREAFRDYPRSALGLISVLLSLDPAYRGSATSALQHDFFNTSPLACDLTGLPVIQVDEDDEAQTNERRKHRKSRNRRSRTLKEHRKKDQAPENPNGDSAPPKEETATKAKLVVYSEEETVISKRSPSSGTIRTSPDEEIKAPLPTPETSSQSYQFNMSESHPNAKMNIKNRPPLPGGKRISSKYNAIDNNDNYRHLSQVQRSVSTREYQKMDPRRYDLLDD